MGRTAPLLIAAAMAAGGTAAPSAAAAQCRLCDTPSTAPVAGSQQERVHLEVETSLDFDKLILLGPGEGTATLRPDGSHEVSGIIGTVSGRAMVGSATVRGEPGRSVRVELPGRIDLHSLRGGRISIEQIVSDLPAMPRLDRSGSLSFRFGGRLRVSGDAEGDYRGDVPITVEYF